MTHGLIVMANIPLKIRVFLIMVIGGITLFFMKGNGRMANGMDKVLYFI